MAFNATSIRGDQALSSERRRPLILFTFTNLITAICLALLCACTTYYEYHPAPGYEDKKTANGYGNDSPRRYANYVIAVCDAGAYVHAGTICNTSTFTGQTTCTPVSERSNRYMDACALQYGLLRYRITKTRYHASPYPVEKFTQY